MLLCNQQSAVVLSASIKSSNVLAHWREVDVDAKFKSTSTSTSTPVWKRLKRPRHPCIADKMTDSTKRLSTQYKWLGHVLRMPEDRPATKAFNWDLEEKRIRGRPRTTWKDTVM